MPVKIEGLSIEYSAINQMARDYEFLYETLEEIVKMTDYNYAPGDMRLVAKDALDRVKTIGGE